MIKVFEMFAGYGGASFALKKAGIEHEVVGYSEIDKYVIQCWEQNHKGKNFGDCTKINTDELPDFDLLTGGFPCQDVSIAGKRDLTKGRTNLYQEILRIAEVKKPKYMLLENVKGLLSIGKDRNLRDIIIEDLKKLGYGVAFKCLNSKDFGIPQNRERVWFVCKLGGWKFGEFQFPIERELKLFIKDILEDDVDSKYYLSEEQITRLFSKDRALNERFIDKNYSSTSCARDYKDPKVVLIEPQIKFNESTYRIYEDYCRTLCASDSISSIPLIFNPLNGKNSTTESGTIGTSVGSTTSKTAQLIITHNLQQRSFDRPSIQKAIKEGKPIPGGFGHLSKDDGTSYCLDQGNTQAIEYNHTIRKLTPKECFRLMGFLKDEINLDGISDSQQYKLAGNGWDINLVSLLFKEMYKQKKLSEE